MESHLSKHKNSGVTSSSLRDCSMTIKLLILKKDHEVLREWEGCKEK